MNKNRFKPSRDMHTIVQSYFALLYQPFSNEIKESLFAGNNERYGELCYYSVVKLLKHLNITRHDNFLDLGSGLGKLLFQIALTTEAQQITGIEINPKRYAIASSILATMKNQLPEHFKSKNVTLIEGDFLEAPLHSITMIYVCNMVFSSNLLDAIGKKINTMETVKTVVSFRKLPYLSCFKLTKKIFLHASWDYIACYLYKRENNHE